MKDYCNRHTGELSGKMGSTTKHMTETHMEKSMGGASSDSLQDGTTMRKSIGRGMAEKMNIPGANSDV